MALELYSIHIENLRGFTNTSLSLNKKNIIIVGPNNSGKTSVLLLLKCILSDWPKDILKSNYKLPESILEQIIPARHTKHKARRITLSIKIADGRSHSLFECRNGVAFLRVNLRMNPVPHMYLALGSPKRSEKSESTPSAIELFDRLHANINFIHIPSFRDGRSDRFASTITAAFHNKLENSLLHKTKGGYTKEYREFNSAFSKVNKLSEDAVKPLWNEVLKQLPKGLAKEGNIKPNITKEDLIKYYADRLDLKISTGIHDDSKVPIVDLGAGLQSLLDLVINLGESISDKKHTLLAIEEPEAFLHPSAQRSIAKLLYALNTKYQVLVTTHSPTIVEEAQYGEVVLCHNHKYYEPLSLDTSERCKINTALLSGYGAEMVFASSVLLVEGEGDRQFFERLRRRLSNIDTKGLIDKLFVVPVGGKTSFSPWIQLLQSYMKAGQLPIQWLITVDSDASGDVQVAFRDAKIHIEQHVIDELNTLGSAVGLKNKVDIISGAKNVNKLTETNNTNITFYPIDLEYASLHAIGEGTMDKIINETNVQATSTEDLMIKMGSKVNGNVIKRPSKAPWIRGFLGEIIPPDEISPSIYNILKRWLLPVMSQTDVQKIIKQFKNPNN